MRLEADPDVQAVAEYMQANFTATKVSLSTKPSMRWHRFCGGDMAAKRWSLLLR